MAKKFWRKETAIFLGIWFLLMIFGRSRLFHDPGTFWHTVVGERILSSGKLIYSDPFSFTHLGRHWIAQEWLGECIMALIHRVAGLDGLLLAAVTLLSFFYTWIAHRLLRSGIHPLLAVFIISLALAASSNNLLIRPHLATIVLLGVTLAMLVDFEAGRTSFRALFWLAPLFVLWANIHGGYLGGLGTLLVVVSGWIFMRLPGMESPISGSRRAFALAALAILCGLAAFVNPYGVELPKAWFSIIGSRMIPKLIMEHAPLTSSKSTMYAVLPGALLYIAVLAGVLPWRRSSQNSGRWPRATWLVPLVWLCLGFERIRNTPLFAASFAIVMPEMLPRARWVQWLSHKGSEVCRIRARQERPGAIRITHFIVPAMVIALTFTLQAVGMRVPVFGAGWAKLNPAYWPVGMLGELKKIESREPPGTRIFNDMLYGGFLIYYAPRLRIFIDDRCELYGDKGLSAYADLLKNPERIGRLARKFGFGYALIKNSSPFDRYFIRSKNWSLVKRTGCAALFVRVPRP